MILFTHPTGNANVRHAALALQGAGLLEEFWTCLNYRDESLLGRVLPPGVRQQLRRRSNPAILQPYVRTFSTREAGRLLAARAGLTGLIRHETGPFSVDAVYRSLDAHVARRLSDARFRAVYAYEDGAASAFRAAERLGKVALYDLPIGYWRAARGLLLEEAELQPAWASTLHGNRDSASKTDRKDEELAGADVVFVASSFTRKTLDAAPAFAAPVVVIPYGAPAAPEVAAPRPGTRADQPIKALFVGSLGQRKGLSYLFDACRRLEGAVDLTVIGTRPQATCPALDRELSRVRWIAGCSHGRVLEEMAAHDVFLFPSLFEGFGLVLLEAMAMGLPIITTPNTAGPDLIEDGQEGFIVPIRDSAAIAERLERLHEDRSLLATMSTRAHARARAATWDAYGGKLAACVRSALNPAPATHA